ncbi:MAG TPA: serine hydrolase domain-containing protein [Pyrinomonadaceae bacterium]|jgi:CubicO group peptidase (beta-lactamase class C family)|nr:serine hydrolase domain-containing protein [Pyrinomonadaceae bacterium]
MKPTLLIIFLTLCLANSSLAQQDRAAAAKLDRVVNAQMSANKIPGVSLAVLRAGKIVHLKSYGLANVEHQVPVKPETIFQSGSMGKQFTAAAVMILVQENKLSLDDPVSKYFPDVPATWKQITIYHLLTHTSGLGDYPPEIDLKRDYSEDELLAAFKKAPLDFEPGTNWNYSNIGYATLGILIGKITGKFYGEFLRERIFEPLGMTTARVISEADIVPNRAGGYRLVRGELKNQEWVSPSTNSTADGSLYFSILDLAKWDAALYTDRPLTQSSREKIWTPAKLRGGTTKDYGFGWHLGEYHGHRLVFHGGAWQGFKTFIMRFLDTDLTIIFLANSWETRDFKFARRLASVFYPAFALPNVKTIDDPDPKTTSVIRRALTELAMHSDKSNQTARNLKSFSLPVAIIHSSELIERKTENNLRVYRYLLTDIGHSAICTVKLTPDDKLASVELK